MIVLEFKAKGKASQYQAIDEAIRTSQFIQNKCIRYWMDNRGVSKADLSKYTKVLARQFTFAKNLNAMSRQASAERAWSAIARFYNNCKKGIKPTGYPKFKKHSRSVEYKTQCWKLLSPKRIHFKEFGTLKLLGTYDLAFYSTELIKRVRVVRRADGYYIQFCIKIDVTEEIEPSKQVIGLDVGLEYFYADSNGNHEENPRFYRKNEKKRSRLNRRFSRTQKGSNNRVKARKKLAKLDLKISRQRIEHAKRLARCVVHSNDVIVYENLQVRNLIRNHSLAKSISDAGWYQFRCWLEYFGKKFGKITVAVEPHFTSQECSSCGKIIKKSLSTRTHKCSCGCELQRDHNAALNILKKGLGTVGHIGTLLSEQNASGETTSLLAGFNQSMKADSLKEESS
ncbi:RNA-guided endonuclease InsQ/TnpB family protein [Capilliphycus salinus ALCB114379]|uniref:RNA-guided endonuclease InsQ/TnpB family protein n=1 Tax=Capilliphycus salinus TaxID=2768948 RepID=UPI0039A4F206